MKTILALLLVSLSLSVLGQTNQTENPYSLINSLGFESQFSETPQFDLPDLQRRLHTLEEYKGKWLLIAFWATWCGPCKMELPELEQLYARLKLKNFNIVGISADQGDVQEVQRFVKELKLTFPILHDLHGEASTAFAANALPSLYLVTPDLKLVGIARGARPWSSEAIIATFEKLLKSKTVEAAELKSGGTAPIMVEAPVLEIAPLSEITEGSETLLKIKIHWKGEPSHYIVGVPKITFPTEIVLNGSVSSTSEATESEAVLNYLYPVTFTKAGNYQLGPITMAFKSALGGTEQASRHAGLTVVVKEKSWKLAYVTVTAILISGFFFFSFKKYRRKKVNHSASLAKPKTDWENRLMAIKKLRLDGLKKEYTLELLQLNLKFQKEQNQNTTKIEEQLEKIRFAGFELTEMELDYYEKDFKRAIEGESL